MALVYHLPLVHLLRHPRDSSQPITLVAILEYYNPFNLYPLYRANVYKENRPLQFSTLLSVQQVDSNAYHVSPKELACNIRDGGSTRTIEIPISTKKCTKASRFISLTHCYTLRESVCLCVYGLYLLSVSKIKTQRNNMKRGEY